VKFAGIIAQRGVNFILNLEIAGVCSCRLTNCSQKVLCNNSFSCFGGCGGTQETNVPITYFVTYWVTLLAMYTVNSFGRQMMVFVWVSALCSCYML
jgi:hypothetical protein